MAKVRTRRVALVGLGLGGMDAEILKGLFAVRAQGRPWLFADAGHGLADLDTVLDEPLDAAVGHFRDPAVLSRFTPLGVPVIDLAGQLQARGIASVTADDEAIAAMAGDFLIERGFEAFCFFPSWEKAARRAAFAAVVGGVGRTYYEITPRGNLDDEAAEVARIVAGRRESGTLAVLAAYDRFAVRLSERLREAGVSVPEQVGILGVDNTALVCESGLPALSSIAVPGEEIGRRVAGLLDRAFSGQGFDPAVIRLPPSGVVERDSTDVTRVDDPRISRALQVIREHAAEGINTTDVAEAVGLKRTTFSRRFKRATGRDPSAELDRARVELARRQLVQTHDPVKTIAYSCGYSDPAILTRRFRARFGVTPSAFRRRARSGASRGG